MKMTIGANIKRLRTAKEITQEQLSVAMNVTCAAVSKWERGETYPDITLLQPLAYYFGVSLDELMGYDQEKIAADIDEVLALYSRHWDDDEGREIIAKAYRDYSNDYRVMSRYMWNVAGDLADNDPAVLLARREELLSICDKLLEGCTEDSLRLGAWNMRAKILHAEGKTEEALQIYRSRFTSWYGTGEQKTEQLFAKDTPEYYFHVQRNLYDLASFAADKFGRTVFFDPSLSMEEKVRKALHCCDLLLNAFEDTGEIFFLTLAASFADRMENDLYFRGGTDEQVAAVMDRTLDAMKRLEALRTGNPALDRSYDRYSADKRGDLFAWNLSYRANAVGGRRAELLRDPAYAAVLEKYR